jgi:hypothetical protein
MLTQREEGNIQEIEEVEMDFYASLMFLSLSRLVEVFNDRLKLDEAGISQEAVKQMVMAVYADLNARNEIEQ